MGLSKTSEKVLEPKQIKLSGKVFLASVLLVVVKVYVIPNCFSGPAKNVFSRQFLNHPGKPISARGQCLGFRVRPLGKPFRRLFVLFSMFWLLEKASFVLVIEMQVIHSMSMRRLLKLGL